MESSLPRRAVRLRKRGIGPAQVLMGIAIVFQLTVLSDTMNMHGLSRAMNSVSLLVFAAAGAMTLADGRAMRSSRVYLSAVLLVIAGQSINIARSLSFESLSTAGSLLAWMAAVSVPYLRSYRLDGAWKLFYRFMVAASVLALVEYAGVFLGILHTTEIETQRGTYLKAVLTLFYGLEDGSVHERMYGLFAEPGTYAMFLLPVMLYAWLQGQRWAVGLFLLCMYFTESLGGGASVLVMAVTYLFWRAGKRPVGLLVALAIGGAIMFYASGTLRANYEKKQLSATVREDNVTLFRDNFASIVMSNPLGLPLTDLTKEANNYLGSNFEMYTLFVVGGILACVGYTVLFGWIVVRSVRFLLNPDRDLERATAMISLPAMLLFIFQRPTVITYSMFAFLYAPALLATDRPPLPAAPPVRRRKRIARPQAPPVAVIEPG